MKTIQSTEYFPGVGCAELFALYTDADLHSEVTGAQAIIEPQTGSNYSAHDGYCFGVNLLIETNRRIVQTWRANNWPPEWPDSIVILSFENGSEGAILHFTQSDLHDSVVDEIYAGWSEYYWDPWKLWLAAH